jgi:uncharacterized protein YeeX (DUF496 family)
LNADVKIERGRIGKFGMQLKRDVYVESASVRQGKNRVQACGAAAQYVRSGMHERSVPSLIGKRRNVYSGAVK